MLRFLAVLVLVVALGAGALSWYALPRHAEAAPATGVVRFPQSGSEGMLEKPAVALDAAGRAVVAWACDTGANERTLFLACSADGGQTFAAPTAFRKVPVRRYKAQQRGKEVTRSSHVQPRLAATGSTIILGWTEPVNDGSVHFLTARSEDGGNTFAAPLPVHGPGAARAGYTGLSAAADGTLGAAWLDNRNGRQQPFCALAPPSGPFAGEQLAYAGPNGRGICPCCDVEVLTDANGTVYVAFRNNDKDIRDIFVARAPAGATAFEPPVPVCTHGWNVSGCPHDGPALALCGGRLHVAWMDAHSGTARVYHAHSALARLAFQSAPLDPHGPAQGHPRLAAAAGYLHAVWDSSLGAEAMPVAGHHHDAPVGAGRAIRYARWQDDADGPAAAQSLDAQAGVFQLNPALAVSATGQALVAWLELTDTSKAIAVCRVNEH